MVRKYRFLSALMLAVCLSASFFIPSKVNAYGLSCWWDSCDELSEEQMKVVAKDYLNLSVQTNADRKALKDAGVESYYDQLGKTNCEQCAKNISQINTYVINNWKSLCIEKNNLNNATAEYKEKALAKCETFKKQMGEETSRELACSDQEAKNVMGMSGALISAGLAVAGVAATAALVTVAVVGAPVTAAVAGAAAVVTGVLTVGAAIGTWLFARQVSGEAETFGAKFTEILNRFMGENSGCWFCSAFDVLFDAINKMATDMYNDLRGLFLAFLAIFTMAWLLWTVFKFITTIHGPNVGELMTKLFKGLGAAMIIAIILRAPPYFITRYIVDPFAIFGTELSAQIFRSRDIEVGTIEYTAYSVKDGGYNCGSVTLAPDVTVKEATSQKETRRLCEPIKDNDPRFNEKALSAEVYSSLNCLLRTISAELVFGLALGATLISEGIRGGFASVLPQFDILAVGIIIFVAYFLLFFKVPFKMVDLLIRLGFVIVLLPLFIVCMVTPATRGYSKKAWDMFLGCWISLIALCLSVALIIALIGDTLLKEIGGEE